MYRYEAAPAFWRSYRKLNPAQQQAAKRAWQIFKRNPSDHTHNWNSSPRIPKSPPSHALTFAG
ncbi:MAG: hypothetical protein MUF81_07225 [Verrucomicrobia bacterium]|jgi:hypothetical protein|nr:hypothetical protein [Verrucomicrobiota bacterium]